MRIDLEVEMRGAQINATHSDNNVSPFCSLQTWFKPDDVCIIASPVIVIVCAQEGDGLAERPRLEIAYGGLVRTRQTPA